MKRIWQRYRTWFLAVLPGLAMAALLAWWFTPRPIKVVALPEVPDEFKDGFAHRFRENEPPVRLFAKRLPWVTLELGPNETFPLSSLGHEDEYKNLRFLNVETGELVSQPILLPGPEAEASDPVAEALETTYPTPLHFSSEGRFLTARSTLIMGAATQIDWFDPATKESGSVPISELEQSPHPVDSKLAELLTFEPVATGVEAFASSDVQLISADGKTLINFRQTEPTRAEVTAIDLQNGATRSQSELQVNWTPSLSQIRVNHDASRIAIGTPNPWSWDGARSRLDVYDTRSGRFVELLITDSSELNARWKSALSAYPQIFTYPSEVDCDEERTLVRSPDDSLVIKSDKKTIWEMPTPLGSWPFFLFVGERSPPMLAQGTTGFVQPTYKHRPGFVEQYVQPVSSYLKLNLQFEENLGDGFVWTDWKTNEQREFRVASRGEQLSGTFAVRKNRICLLVDPAGPNPRVEIWDAPPPKRPVMAIWISSLLGTIATWFWLHRREKQRVAGQ